MGSGTFRLPRFGLVGSVGSSSSELVSSVSSDLFLPLPAALGTPRVGPGTLGGVGDESGVGSFGLPSSSLPSSSSSSSLLLLALPFFLVFFFGFFG